MKGANKARHKFRRPSDRKATEPQCSDLSLVTVSAEAASGEYREASNAPFFEGKKLRRTEDTAPSGAKNKHHPVQPFEALQRET